MSTTDLWKKLNLKPGTRLFVDDAHDAMLPFMGDERAANVSDRVEDADFLLGFATTVAEIDAHVQRIDRMTASDPVVWIAYPKQSSKRYVCEFNRDSGWDGLGAIGFEPVRQVAIDADWSALRFRRVQHIKTMVRTFAMTEEGKAKASTARDRGGI